MHDPEVFDDPMIFKPERYLKNGRINKEILDPNDVAFGYGRRFVDLLLFPYDIYELIASQR
jgi:cytochrome P450